jgi:hypothetical protein
MAAARPPMVIAPRKPDNNELKTRISFICGGEIKRLSKISALTKCNTYIPMSELIKAVARNKHTTATKAGTYFPLSTIRGTTQ